MNKYHAAQQHAIRAMLKRGKPVIVRRPLPYRGQLWARCTATYLTEESNSTVHLTHSEFIRLPEYCCLNQKYLKDTLVWYIDSGGHERLGLIHVV